MTEVDEKCIRDLAIALLDDDNGINESAFELLGPLLFKTGNQDIVKCVDACEGRFYLKENTVEQLKKA